MRIHYRQSLNILVLSFCVSAILSCGRYGKPLAPELFSPEAVQDLRAEASLEGFKILWTAPDSDVRGEELKSLDGFIISRKELKSKEETDFEKVGTVQDTYIKSLQKLKKEARAAGKPTRKIKIDEKLKMLEFFDKDLTPGSIYLYKIVPFNQGDVKGAVKQNIRLIFRGDNSEIEIFDQSADEADDLDSVMEEGGAF